MSYLLKEDKAKEIRQKYKNSYISEELGLTKPYISTILHRTRPIKKHLAYCFTKVVDSDLEINDLFEVVDKEK